MGMIAMSSCVIIGVSGMLRLSVSGLGLVGLTESDFVHQVWNTRHYNLCP